MKKMKKTFATLILMMTMLVLMVCPVFAADHPARVVDNSQLMTDTEIADLSGRLDAISNQYGIDVCVIMEPDFSQGSVQAAADDFFDYNGYGLGEHESGIMFYLSTDEGYWAFSTKGDAISMFSDDEMQEIIDQMADDLRAKNYSTAYSTYATLCEKEIIDETSFHGLRRFGISLGIGILVGLIYLLILKSQLTSVAPVDSAAEYVVDGSLHVTRSNEIFLYKNVIVTKRETSSGSSTHTSSSGSSHGGISGKL